MCRSCACALLVLLMVALATAIPQQAEEDSEKRYGQRVTRQEPGSEEGSREDEAEYQDTTSRRVNHQRARQDDASEGASSYSSMIMHNQETMSPSNLQYKNVRAKALKGRPKAVRQSFRETVTPNHKYKAVKLPDQPSPTSQAQLQSQVSSDQFVQEIHPSVMQRLMKQQPQTFDDQQQRETEDYEQPQFEHQRTSEESNESNYDIRKRPIYVPNRVSVQNPSTDSSFNVGYSIGFGNGFNHQTKLGVVDPPLSYRQSKGLNYPTSYQSTAVNVHFDGRNSVWKNMGSGVEMSYNLDSEPKQQSSLGGPNNDYNGYSTGSVVNQPIYFRESSEVPTEGRNTFDHNYALQQSNPFDFSNAIDPAKNLPPSTEQSSDDEPQQLSDDDSFSRHTFPSFEPFNKPMHSSQSESFMKSSPPSFLDLNQHRERAILPAHNVQIVGNEKGNHYGGYKFENPVFERPSFVPTKMSSFRVSHPVTLVGKPKPIDFYKSGPFNTKQAYNIKPIGNNEFNYINTELHGSSFDYSSFPIPPQPYDHSAPKAAPVGMVQAILVPVNAPIPPYAHPLNTPMPSYSHPVEIPGYSPYLGQQVGYIKVPKDVEENPLSKQEFDHQEFATDGPSDAQELSPYFKKPTAKVVRSHYVSKYPKMETKYLHRPSQPRLRIEEQDLRGSMKYKKIFSTESPELSPSELKPQSTTPHNPSSDKSSVTSHPQRVFRSRPILIVKRS